MNPSEHDLIEHADLSLSIYFDDDHQKKAITRQELLSWLTQKIIFLLLHDMEKLLHILYRIDVKESLVKDVFAQHDPKKIAPLLAELILNREIEKVHTRLKYRKS
jgi:hypothetical protein